MLTELSTAFAVATSSASTFPLPKRASMSKQRPLTQNVRTARLLPPGTRPSPCRKSSAEIAARVPERDTAVSREMTEIECVAATHCDDGVRLVTT